MQLVAPKNLTQDAYLKFRATLTTTGGATDSDDVHVVVAPKNNLAPISPSALFDGIKVSPVHAYKGTSPYAGILASCVYDTSLFYANSTSNNLCPFSKLPLIGQTAGGSVPTVEQVMNQVLVSHDWMGANFENFLKSHDANGDFRRLLGSVTAVVIGSHVRPSFYFVGTGAIYLDAENFWLTPDERDVVNEAPDFRASFGNELQYELLWRYTLNNQRTTVFFSRASRISRSADYLPFEISWLLYHELAHANDFLSSNQRSSLLLQTNTLDTYLAASSGSQALTAQYPLASSEMADLAKVRFRGEPATALQKSYTPATVAGFFAPDRATDDYSYTSQFEDFALLFEEFMLLHRQNIRRDVAVTGPITPTTTGDNLLVTWGQRSRATEASIKPRVKTVLQQMAPWVDPNIVDMLGAPIPMRVGQSWNSNLVLQGIPGKSFGIEMIRSNEDDLRGAQQRFRETIQAHDLREAAISKLRKAGAGRQTN